MKRKTAKEILAESFRELAEIRSIDKITVKEITENCGYSPATFYRQFKDKYDLIAWDYTREFESILSSVTGDSESFRKTLLSAARYFDSQKGYLENLFLHTGGLDSFIYHMKEIHFNWLKAKTIERSSDTVPDDKMEMVVRAYVLGTVHLTCEWILGAFEMSPEELAEVYEYSMPEALWRYFP